MKDFCLILILIGCPSSGKTTLANDLIRQNPNYQIVSTDQTRAQLFGDEEIQGNWKQVENEIFEQIEQYIKSGHSVIYDATNAKRPWRVELIQKLKQFGEINIIGLHIKTPLEICKQWNQQRERKVPDSVIESYYQSLNQFPPVRAEGFATICDISFKHGSLDLNNLEKKLNKAIPS